MCMNYVKIFADKNFVSETYLINCLLAGCTLQWRSNKEGRAYLPMAMPSWTVMLNSQLFLLSGAANLAAGKLVIGQVWELGWNSKQGIEKIDQLIMLSLTAMLNKQLFLLSGAANLAAGKLVGIENLAEIRVGKIYHSWLCLAKQPC